MNAITPQANGPTIPGYLLKTEIQAVIAGIAQNRVAVKFGGDKAFTDGAAYIQLPEISPTQSYDEKGARVLRGYANHETFHHTEDEFQHLALVAEREFGVILPDALKATRAERIQNTNKKPKLNEKEINSIIEAAAGKRGVWKYRLYCTLENVFGDYRIEREGGRKWPGARINLGYMRAHITERDFKDICDGKFPISKTQTNIIAIFIWLGIIENAYPTAPLAQACLDKIEKADPDSAAIAKYYWPKAPLLQNARETAEFAMTVAEGMAKLFFDPPHQQSQQDQNNPPDPSDQKNQPDPQDSSKNQDNPPNSGPSDQSNDPSQSDAQTPPSDPKPPEKADETPNKPKPDASDSKSGETESEPSEQPQDNDGPEPQKDGAPATEDPETPENSPDDTPDDSNPKANENPPAPPQPDPAESNDGAPRPADDSKPQNPEPQAGQDQIPHNNQTGDKDADKPAPQDGPPKPKRPVDGDLDPDQFQIPEMDLSDILGQIEETTKKSAIPQDRRIVTTKMRSRQNPAGYREILLEIGANASRTATSLRNLLKSRNTRHEKRHQTDGDLDFSNIVGLALGEREVFKKRSEQKGVRTDLALLLDNSSSMTLHEGEKTRQQILTETTAAIVNAIIMNRDVSLAILAYTGTAAEVSISNLKNFDDAANVARAAVPMLVSGELETNFTPSDMALQAAWSLLHNRKTPRRMIIWITDGEPDDRKATIESAQTIIASGAKLIGIGIGSNAPSMPIPGWIKITDISDLPNELLSILKNTL